MSDLFISYSRRDQEFVRALADRLAARDKSVWVDWEDIPPTAEWVREIYEGIEGSDALAFVISPDSARSQICLDEIEHARTLNKRIVPILRRDVPKEIQLPEAIASRNWIFIRDSADLDEAVDGLVDVLDRDLDHVRQHTRLLERALEWERRDRDKSLLLRGTDLREAEGWLVAGAAVEPAPTPPHYEYVQASRAAATRRQRILVAALAAGIAIALALAAVALVQRNEAVAARKTAESRLVAGEALTQLGSRLDVGALLALAAYRIKPTREARASVLIAARRSDHVLRSFDGGDDVKSLRFGPRGLLAAGRADGRIVLRSRMGERILGELRLGAGAVRDLAFSSDGTFVAAANDRGVVGVWRLDRDGSARRVADLRAQAAAFAPGSHALFLAAGAGVSVWRGGTRVEPVARLTRPAEDLAVASDGTIAAGGLVGVTVLVPRSGRPPRAVPVGSDQVVQDLAFEASGHRLVIVEGERVFVWSGGGTLDALPVTGATRAAFGQGGKLATGALSGDVTVWAPGAAGWQQSAVMRLRDAAVDSVAFAAEDDVVASASGRSVTLWSPRPQLERELSLPGTLDDAAVVGRDSFVAGGEQTVVHGDATGMRFTDLAAAPQGPIRVAASRDGHVVAAGGLASQTIVVWARRRPQPPLSWADDRPVGVALSADGTTVVAATQHGTLDEWEWRHAAKAPRITRAAHSPLTALASAPSGALFATGAQDGTLSVVPAGSSRAKAMGKIPRAAVSALAFAPDARHLAAADTTGTITLADVKSRSLRRLVTGTGKRNITSVAFDPDGVALAAGDDSGDVSLWDADHGDALGPPLTFGDPVVAVGFAPSKAWLLIALHGGTIVFVTRPAWDVDAAIESLCSRLARRLSASERLAYLPANANPQPCG